MPLTFGRPSLCTLVCHHKKGTTVFSIPNSFVYTCMPEFICTPHKAVAELGIFCLILAFSSQLSAKFGNNTEISKFLMHNSSHVSLLYPWVRGEQISGFWWTQDPFHDNRLKSCWSTQVLSTCSAHVNKQTWYQQPGQVKLVARGHEI